MTNNSPQRPNLFDYATSELSQDAFLCWLLKWADPRCRRFSEVLHEAGGNLIHLLGAEKKNRLPERIKSVKVEKQLDHIDVLCTINEGEDDRTAILIEDKKGTQEHSNQLQRYTELVKNKFPENRILPVYVQTEDQSDYSEARKHGYAVIRRPDLLDCLEKHTMARQESDILDGFLQHLRCIEDDVQSWKETEPQTWSWNAWMGFYIELQSKPSLGGGWGYVHNPAGGFLAYWFGDWPSVGGTEPYLHIEQGNLCFRIVVKEGADRRALREHWHHAFVVRCGEEEIPARRPARFGSGWTMTVAVVERDGWLMVQDGHVDVASTAMRLEQCLGVVRDCVEMCEEIFPLLVELWCEVDSALKKQIPDLPSKNEKLSTASEETIKEFKDHGLYYPLDSGTASLCVGLERGRIFIGVYCGDQNKHPELETTLKKALADLPGDEPSDGWPWWTWVQQDKNLWKISRENCEFLQDREAIQKYAEKIAQGLKPVWNAVKQVGLA